MDLDGGGAGQRLAGAGERAAGGNDQLDGVPDDDGVVQQVPVGGVLQRAAPHELAVAVAVARVWVLGNQCRISDTHANTAQAGSPCLKAICLPTSTLTTGMNAGKAQADLST